jgi:hypothetical protein
MTMKISSQEIQEFIDSAYPKLQIFNFPCHTQGTERFISLVTKTADKVCESQQEGYNLTTIHARDMNPSFETKRDYKIPIFFE